MYFELADGGLAYLFITHFAEGEQDSNLML